jgi:hypothetical protein
MLATTSTHETGEQNMPSPRGVARRPPASGGVALALVLALAGCASGPAKPSNAITGVDGGTVRSSATTVPAHAKASPSDPLAERSFRLVTPPKTQSQRAVLDALQGYLDATVRLYATNQADAAAFQRYATPDVYRAAKAIADRGRTQSREVTYGAWTYWIRIRATRARLALVDTCADQRRARDYHPGTSRVKGPTSTPFVLTRFTLTLRPVQGWQVSGWSAKAVGSCPQ